MVWKYLFDSEFLQRHDIEDLRGQLQLEATTSAELAGAVRTQVQQVSRRVARLELALEAMIRVLEVRQVMTRQELVLMIQRVDLADGVEDGCIGPDRRAEAPACPSCGHPVNAQRETCLYCDAPIPKLAPVAPRAAAAPSRTVCCTRCGATIPERDSYFTDSGLVCGGCFTG